MQSVSGLYKMQIPLFKFKVLYGGAFHSVKNNKNRRKQKGDVEENVKYKSLFGASKLQIIH